MARPTLSSHPKFAKLSARLKSRALARGVLELIWETCYASGEPAVGDTEALEAIADWRGETGELTSALVQAGFIDLQTDANGGHLLVVHDLEDHAPDYVLKRWEREAKRKAKGLTLREIRQEAARASWSDRNASVRRLQANVLPPTPAPAPARKEECLPAGAQARSREDANGGVVDPREPPERSSTDPRPALYELPAGPITGYGLTKLFGAIRAREVGGWEWQGVRTAGGRDSSMADMLNEDPTARADVAPTMALLFKRARDHRAGPRSDEIITEPSFAFAAWCSMWTSLREELHGQAPKVQKAPDDPRCSFHRRGFRGRLPREGAYDSCPECKHAKAVSGTRTGDATSVADVLATDRKVAELRQAAGRSATPEELARLRDEMQRDRAPAKAVAG